MFLHTIHHYLFVLKKKIIKVCQVCINCIYIGYFLKNNLFKIIYMSLVPKICHFNISSQLASHVIKVIANKSWFVASNLPNTDCTNRRTDRRSRQWPGLGVTPSLNDPWLAQSGRRSQRKLPSWSQREWQYWWAWLTGM